MRNPLSAKTIEDIQGTFALIAARERELRGDAPPDLPVFADPGPTARIVDFDAPETPAAPKTRDKD